MLPAPILRLAVSMLVGGLVAGLAGFIIGIMSFQEEDRHYVLSRIGVLLNFAIMLLWGSMYLIGI